jgi:thiosulfate dehydrogenase
LVLIFNMNLRRLNFLPVLFLLGACSQNKPNNAAEAKPVPLATAETWEAPDTATLGNSEHDKLVKYGRELISRTAFFLGPQGTVAHKTNGMNCQNCHLEAGTKLLGNNYSAVAATYPKYRERSGTKEDIYHRVNDCMARSLNGKMLDTASREMQAMKAYIEWLGKDVPKGKKPAGAGIFKLAYLDQATDIEKGKLVYVSKCQSCHGENGAGKMDTNRIMYQYPPLWGSHSFTTAAGLYRVSNFAGYVKSNMPFGASNEHPQLSDEEAWNVAAFVNSQPRPVKTFKEDWPKLAEKPVDFPFAPYADTFSEKQHKYGPFLPIAEYRKNSKKNSN